MENQAPRDSLAEQKKALRRGIRHRLKELNPEYLLHAGLASAARLEEHPYWQKALAVLLYASLPTEIDTAPLFRLARQRGKKVFFPRIVGEDIQFFQVDDETDLEIQSPLRIPEPRTSLVSLSDWLMGLAGQKAELAPPDAGSRTREEVPICGIIPGLAFDRQGGRLGKGKGYYDRFLSSIGKTVLVYPPSYPSMSLYTIGLCLPEQLVDQVPRDLSDMLVDEVILVP
ncbi:5-formyltetrahydrofolate cyclo-ligase [Gracilinema caldarium]|uniref:5-formyltetrahydrofolate cyclo-ligase n=1 Tax=Gracilinema caldarium TaxID=215591 RepID=UPI0026F22B32|nr:5-formyltetrahydrofolate cyclo-ligase [Gracilinema caldarium]